jgi:hypothetical protein
MALASGSLFNVTATATTGNVNGAGFNPANVNFPTDGVIASGTGASPTISSATHSFAAGDVGAAIFLPTQANIVQGFYPIASVAGGVATLNAAVGAAWQFNAATNMYAPSTVAGCATTSAPTGIEYGVNYAMQDTAIINGVADFTALGASTTMTSATANFTPVMVGNFFHQTTTGTGAFGVVGWYEIVSYVSATTVVLDRTENTGTTSVACTGYVGGAGRFNGLENTFQAMWPAASNVWVKNGTYTFSAGISTGSTNSTSTSPSSIVGYNIIPGDVCNQGNRPIFALGANSVTWSQSQYFINIIITGTAANTVTFGTGNNIVNCKITNSSITTSRNAVQPANQNGANTSILGSEIISQNGNALNISVANPCCIVGNYIHDSVNGIADTHSTSIGNLISNNLMESNTTNAIRITNATFNTIQNNTFYGSEAKMGIGLDFTSASTTSQIFNNIFYGLTTGFTNTTTNAGSIISMYNDYFNNTTDVTLVNKGSTDLALNPTFTSVSQVTGTVGQGLAGSKFQDITQNFVTAGVVANRDYLHITSGGSLTAGGYLITAITTTTNTNDTLTLNNSPGTGAATGVYWITVGHNFTVGNSSLKGAGFPSFTNTTGSLTTGYPTPGAIQAQATGGTAGTVGYAYSS